MSAPTVPADAAPPASPAPPPTAAAPAAAETEAAASAAVAGDSPQDPPGGAAANPEPAPAAAPRPAAKRKPAAKKKAGAAKTAGTAKTASTAKTAKTTAKRTKTTAESAKTTKTAAKAAGKTDSKTAPKTAKTTEKTAAKTTKPAAKAAAPARTGTGTRSRSGSAAKPDANANGKAPAPKSRSRSGQRIRKRRPQYKVGQQLVYPLQGVGQVRNIEERPFRDATLLYYVVYLEVSDMTIMVPVDRADELGIRAIVPRAEARSALALISEDYEPIPTDWKLRYQMNLDLLKAGTVNDIAAVVRALYHRSRIKELPILERKLYDNARSLLVDELSFSLGKDKAKVEELINSRLEVGVK